MTRAPARHYPDPHTHPFGCASLSVCSDAHPVTLVGDDSAEVPPDPIPNSEVKLLHADGTARVTVWESRYRRPPSSPQHPRDAGANWFLTPTPEPRLGLAVRCDLPVDAPTVERGVIEQPDKASGDALGGVWNRQGGQTCAVANGLGQQLELRHSAGENHAAIQEVSAELWR